AVAKQVAARPGFKIVGAIDIDPAKVGRDVGDVVGLPRRVGAKVSGDAAKALRSAKPDVVILCTSSSIKKVMPQIETILNSKTEQFQKKVDDGSVRHVGLTESIAMIADALGWTLDRITDEIQPKLASVTISSEFLAVDPGYVCGIVQDGAGYRKKEPVIKLH